MMYCSGEALVTLMLLGVGLLAATMHLQSKGQQLSNSIVAPPMIAMASQQGPWPKCLGLTGEDCAAYIESSTTQAQDSLDILIVKHGSVSIRDFQKDRVRIFVDDQGIVNSIPGKG